MKLFKNKKILIIGDIMLDSYFFGNVERISPEAPVPIVDIINKENKLGGAANVASNIKNLGGTPILCSVIGKDQNGEILLSLLKEQDILINYIHQSKNRITTNKTRIIGNNHQILRIDEEIKEDLKEDSDKFISLVISAITSEKVDCILFQDYDKGVLNKNIINIIIEKANLLNISILVDPKKKNFNYYKNIELFKPNFKEFKESINLNISDKNELLKKGSIILHNRGINIIFITLSENGIFISYKKENKIISKIVPTTSRNIVDPSGCGDSVISVVSMLINDIDIEEITKISNLAGGIACEKVGVVSIDKNRLLKEYYNDKHTNYTK